ncbi:MAG: VOC family protein [Acidobacteriota bacterium]|nr:VOC family protein [Acidobacteriota bacterium]
MKLHHIGFVVSSIQESAESFTIPLAAAWDGNAVFDPIQRVRVAFFRGLNREDPQIELIEPGAPDSPVSNFLKRGGGLHHLCYEVDDLDSYLQQCPAIGTTVIRRPAPAAAFDGRRIAWGITRKRLLLEFLEARGSGSSVNPEVQVNYPCPKTVL